MGPIEAKLKVRLVCFLFLDIDMDMDMEKGTVRPTARNQLM